MCSFHFGQLLRHQALGSTANLVWKAKYQKIALITNTATLVWQASEIDRQRDLHKSLRFLHPNSSWTCSVLLFHCQWSCTKKFNVFSDSPILADHMSATTTQISLPSSKHLLPTWQKIWLISWHRYNNRYVFAWPAIIDTEFTEWKAWSSFEERWLVHDHVAWNTDEVVSTMPYTPVQWTDIHRRCNTECKL